MLHFKLKNAGFSKKRKKLLRLRDGFLSLYEKIILLLSFSMIITMLTCAAWSGVLLLSGTIEGGGPLGMLMEIIPTHLLLNR